MAAPGCSSSVTREAARWHPARKSVWGGWGGRGAAAAARLAAGTTFGSDRSELRSSEQRGSCSSHKHCSALPHGAPTPASVVLAHCDARHPLKTEVCIPLRFSRGCRAGNAQELRLATLFSGPPPWLKGAQVTSFAGWDVGMLQVRIVALEEGALLHAVHALRSRLHTSWSGGEGTWLRWHGAVLYLRAAD